MAKETRTEAAQRFAIDHIFSFSEGMGYGEVVEALVADGESILPFGHEVLTPCAAYETLSAELLLVELEALYIGAEALLEQFSEEEEN
jgi:hypothetical protein